jgi:pimeloyl-ACP methyl ester carboxylesterase
LADPTFLSPEVQREVYNSDIADQHRQILGKSFVELVEDLQKRHPNRSLETIKLIARARFQTSIAAFDVLTPPNPDYRQLMSAIIVPSLLIIGDKGVVSSVVAEELQRLNPRLLIERIPEAGHGLHYDQPERFAAIVGSFMHSIRTVIDSFNLS